jgi:glycosyltransferase involved in cell wall biosynthesis
MHIVNAMFARGLGGIEQAFFDYTEALLREDQEVTALLHPQSAMLPEVEALGREFPRLHIIGFSNLGVWDVLAVLRLKRLLMAARPQAIITHGTRAASLMKLAAGRATPVVALAHNYSLKRLVGAAAIFAITKDIARAARQAGQPEDRIFTVPNMLRLPDQPPPMRAAVFRSPVVIGAMGRMVEKKGFTDFIEALALLKERNVPFKALLGGEGPEKEALLALRQKRGLEGQLTFTGWVKDKRAFFESIDIFCLPSRHEPFGIVLLEAMAARLPILTTDSEGPSEIATHGRDALIIPKADARAMADGIAGLLADPVVATRLAQAGLETVRTKYDMKVVAPLIEESLQKTIFHHAPTV